ncbi:MAG: Coenzyme synthetase-like [Hyphomicrobiales bacterium]|nr:Coenzyme synthetase-like [Hyphomicrobiales bacterium]
MLDQVFMRPVISLARPLFFRIAERAAGRNVTGKIAEIAAYYRLSPDRQLRRRHELVVRSLEAAVANVPYYQKRIRPELVARIKKDFAYFNDLPIMTKADVLAHADELVSLAFDPNDLKRMKTGGSAGPSAYFFYDREAIDWSGATTWFCRSHYESALANKQLHFACDFNETAEDAKFDWRRFGEHLATHRDNVFTREFSDRKVEEYLGKVVSAGANLVHSHPSTMYLIAQKSISQSGPGQRYFRVYEPSGEVLHPYQESTIKRAFHCDVANRYGLAEAGVIAYQIDPDAEELRLMNHLVFFDESVRGEETEITFTTLRNDAMPLIRYRSGDLGVFHASDNGEIVLNKLSGRVHDLVRIGDRTIMTHTLMDILDHRVGKVREFQLVRNSLQSTLTLNIVPDAGFDAQMAADTIARIVGHRLDIRVIDSDELIRVGDRGKFRHLADVEQA